MVGNRLEAVNQGEMIGEREQFVGGKSRLNQDNRLTGAPNGNFEDPASDDNSVHTPTLGEDRLMSGWRSHNPRFRTADKVMKMINRTVHSICVVVLAAALGACGSSDGSSDAAELAGGSGDQQAGSVTAESLGDFPVPGPGVGNAALTSDSDELRAYIITFPAADYAGVVAFYDDWTATQTDDYQRIEAESGGVSWTLVSGEAGHHRIIAASPALPGEDLAFVTLADGRTD